MTTKTLPSIKEKQTLGAEARRLRINLFLTQKKLADLAGISKAQVALLEHNYPVPLDSKRRLLQELWAIKAKK
jgi:transcriptional regulator with XRE-family HTH domain